MVSKFFNGNPVLGSLGGGAEAFEGRAGRKRWAEIEAVIARSWDGVVDAIDGIVTIPDVDSAASEKAAAELAEPAPEPEVTEDASTDDDVVIEDEVDTDPEEAALAAQATEQVLGGDEDFWTHVGIDPIRLLTRGGTFYTLRCYMDDQPIFLGRNGRISVFGSERSLARYLADEHESDLSDLATFDDIKTAATDGSLQIRVTDDNVYVLRTLADDIADGPDAMDVEQLELAVEFVRDVGDYAEDNTVEEALDKDQPLGRFIGHVLSPDKVEQAACAVRQGRRAVGEGRELRGVPPSRGVIARRLRSQRGPAAPPNAAAGPSERTCSAMAPRCVTQTSSCEHTYSIRPSSAAARDGRPDRNGWLVSTKQPPARAQRVELQPPHLARPWWGSR